ncbi:MAG: hypothetical protein R8K20_05550, partial [Gallionellaceae bacterium]
MSNNQMSKQDMAKIHPSIPGAYDQLKQGRISRREFLRFSTLLGMSAVAAQFLAACGAPVEEAAPVVEEAAPAGGIVRGGTLRVATQVPAVDHPGRFSWVYDA